MIDISDIHMIKIISEVGSINKAAEILNVSQPTLSKKVSRLEQVIKMDLFSRDNVGMVPTAAAQMIMQEAEGLRSQLNQIERKLELMANLVGGAVRIGVGPIVEQVMLPKVLLDFAEQNFKFKVAVSTMSQQSLLKALRKSQIDLAIGPFSDDELPDDMISTLATSDRIVVALRPGHPLCQNAAEGTKASAESSISKPKIALEAFRQFKIVSPNVPKSLGAQVAKLVEGSALEPYISCENYDLAKTIVKNTDYVTAGPESLFRREFKEGSLLMMEFPSEVRWHCRCLCKPEVLKMPVVQAVVDLFSQYMESSA